MRFCALPIVVLGMAPGLSGAASVVGLGDLAGGSIHSRAYGVSDGGTVVVGWSYSASGQEAFRWTSDGGMVGLGDFSDGGFGSSVYGDGVSADGSVVVGFGHNASGFAAFRWTSGSGMVGLGNLAGGRFSVGHSVSADGFVVVGNGDVPEGREAFRWTSEGGMVGLGDLAGGVFGSYAYGVNADGSVVVGSGAVPEGREAFRWTSEGGMVGLGYLAGGSFSEALGVSADGSVVVGSGTNASGNEAFRWTSDGGMVGLGDMAGGSFNSMASDVSGDGSVVVGFGQSAAGREALVWTDHNGMERLFDVLFAKGATGLSGWTLTEATRISDDGQWVVGFGINPAGQQEAFLANIGSVPIPAAVDDGPILVTEGVAQIISVGSNDTGFGTPVTVAVPTLPTKGTITAITPPGPAAGMTVTYTANIGAMGADSFVYEMTDSTPASDSATVTVNISPTPDTVPDAFAFTDQSGVPLDVVITSNAITVSGLNVPTAVSVVGGEYSINGGAFIAVAGTVSDGSTVAVRQTSSGSPFEATDATVTIGGVSDSFTVTTGEDTDDDGVVDALDNCKMVWNANQCDSDGDGYGNRCDGDMNNNGYTNAQDTVLFRQQLGQPSNAPTYDKADINCSGSVNAQDTVLFRQLLGKPPGASGLVP